jgi:ATP-dependent helicase HrpB
MSLDSKTDLPIDEILPALVDALSGSPNLVVQAPPGAGKTTRIPLALLDQSWLAGRKIVMLEPRRLAAKAAARRMAETLGEQVGETVGYRVRLDAKIGPRTRIEVVTDGVFTRMLQGDPTLDGIGAVLFDEFHERSLDADLALALCLEAQAALRDDLRLIVMSATLDGQAVARLLGDAPIVTSQGRAYPVEIRYLDKPPAKIEDATAAAINRMLASESGSQLVFLPGMREIRRVEGILGDLPGDVDLAVLHGDLARDEQDRAIAPSPTGRRKVVLSSAIAETSLTIEGIRVVIDSGLSRVARFDPRRGMTELATVKVSRASADQRAGRAGRLEPGICVRLWTESEHRQLKPQTAPEIEAADLAPLALELAVWGVTDASALPWLTPPPTASLAQARELLRRLAALDDADRITAHGKAMATLGLHPRLAHMMIRAKAMGEGALACVVAALLSERDVLRGGATARDSDIKARVDLLAQERGELPHGLSIDRQALSAVRASVKQLARTLKVPDRIESTAATGALVALAYPDRVAQRRPGGTGQYRLSDGGGAAFRTVEPLAGCDYLAIAELDGAGSEARIGSAAALSLGEIEELFADQIETRAEIAWDAREEAVLARRERRFGALVLAQERLGEVEPSRLTEAMLDGVRALGLAALPWSKESESFRGRIGLLRRVLGPEWPDLSDEALLGALPDWLGPYLGGITRRGQLSRLNMLDILRARLDWNQLQALDELAPTHLPVPSGSRIPLDYLTGEEPVLAVRLQEMFGLTETPRIAGGRLALLIHLLSPANRPIQVTRDLVSFWTNTYAEVKRDLKGRYPKHYWPDDPLIAEPTARAKRRTN